ncbi:rRNA maturation RNase YbeY [Hoyosella sp. YIM 151337]|uniref:rRNA maturation RNase YbeY n=1 Tax=Hoyosella sp. YIM 151337 TaxID=2992742 RepID=UPI0022357004|nr:rRNA maturation RNase YbeY [Hoyosella sp. YIM 151337]MCW4355305.1 rRNA maturation RNase YbeY [Hoyosella sp. YIM 151337]
MSIEVNNESGAEVPATELTAVARYVLDRLDVHPAAELSMVFVDLEAMSELHEHWMDLPGPTDVMSFPMDEMTPGGRPDASAPGPAMLGDIVICPQFAAQQAKQAGHSVERELTLLTIHGVLHLLGYDHAEPDEEKEMFELQNGLLEDWFETRRAEARKAAQVERDRRLLGKVGLLNDPDESR